MGHGLSLSAATATEQEESRKKIILKIRFLPISVIARTYLRAHSARCACIIPCRKTTTELGVPPPTGGRSRNVSGSPLGRSAWRSTKPDRAAACAARERIAASASADDDNARRVDAGNRTRNHGLRIRRWHNTYKNTKSYKTRANCLQHWRHVHLYRAGWATCSSVSWARRSLQTSGIWCNLYCK